MDQFARWQERNGCYAYSVRVIVTNMIFWINCEGECMPMMSTCTHSSILVCRGIPLFSVPTLSISSTPPPSFFLEMQLLISSKTFHCRPYTHSKRHRIPNTSSPPNFPLHLRSLLFERCFVWWIGIGFWVWASKHQQEVWVHSIPSLCRLQHDSLSRNQLQWCFQIRCYSPAHSILQSPHSILFFLFSRIGRTSEHSSVFG